MNAPAAPTPPARDRTQDMLWRKRAENVIPGGMYGHLSAGTLPVNYPQFYARAKGAQVWDVDGNAYFDLMCAWGPMLLGYADPVVEAAARAQCDEADIANGPSPRMVELAELLVDTVAHADWAIFGKNGNDATTSALTIARAATGRRKVLKAAKAYHGATPWCTPVLGGVTPEDRANIVEFEYNDLASLEQAAADHDGDVAAVIVTPMRHDAFTDQELADPAFALGVRALCDRIGAVLILDEVRTGFRLDLCGSWESLGVRPDLSAFSKALANGYAISAVTGVDGLREALSDVYVTGSFWFSATAMAAALATIGRLRDTDGIAAMTGQGGRLRDGLAAQAAAHGFTVHQTGPVQMPFLRFENDQDCKVAFAFCAEALERGVFLHPWHNWFLSTAHTETVITQVLEATDEAFAATRRTVSLGDT